jgi:hypothetical protein
MNPSRLLLTIVAALFLFAPRGSSQATDDSNSQFRQLNNQAQNLSAQLPPGNNLGPDERGAFLRALTSVSSQMDRIQLDSYNRTASRAIAYTQTVDQLSATRDQRASQTEYFNNVTSLRTKDALDRWVEAQRKRWHAENSGSRIGITNPYDGSSYYRYYDDKGNLIVSRVKNDYGNFSQQQYEDWQRSYNQAKEVYDRLQGDYKQISDQYGEAMALKGRIADLMSESRPTAPSSEQPQGVTIRDGVRYKNFNGVPYPFAEDLGKLPDYRGPRWVGNGSRIVSP